MSGASQDFESKLNESINILYCDLNNLISQLNSNISLKLTNIIPSVQTKDDLDKKRAIFLTKFTEYSPLFVPNFVKDKRPNILLSLFESLSSFMESFYKKAIKLLKLKEEIISRRIISSSSISTYLDSFSIFIKSSMRLTQQYHNSYFQLSYSPNPLQCNFLSYIKFSSSKKRLIFHLNFLYRSFKYYNITTREKIFAKSLDKFRSDLLFSSTLSIPKTSENLEKEIKRISQFCEIPFDLHSHDGQEFFYHCEKAFTESFLIKIPIEFFDITKVENFNENDTFSMINNSIVKTTRIDKDLIKSLQSLFTGNFEEMTKFFNDELFKFNFHKEINRDHLLSFMKLRFVKNKKALISLYDNCKSFISLKSRLTNCEYTENDINLLFKQNLNLIFTFASKLINKVYGEIDYHTIMETALSLELRYERSKGKVINALLTIYDHTNDESVKSFVIELIDKKPNLFYEPLRSYEKQFELNIDVFDAIGQCLWLLINLQILNEQNCSSPRLNNDVYLLSNDSVPISRFEVFPNILYVLKFYKKAPIIAEEICESLSINYLRFNLHITLSLWTCLLEEIKSFTLHCPFPFERTQIPYLTQDVFHLFSNQILDNPEEVEKYFLELKENEKIATFERNFIRINKCLSKLQGFYNLQHSLIPIYNKQLNADIVAPSFELPELTAEFLLDPKFDEKIESVFEAQNQFTKMLLLAVKFNNYQSDSLFIRNHFDLTKLQRDLSALPYEENIKNNLNEFIAFSMFYSFEDFSVDKPLCDLSTNPSYEKYISLYEIAFMAQLEAAFFYFNPIKEYFNFSPQFIDPETNSILPFVIPTVSQCLNIPDNKINDAYSIISSRIRFCHLVRFESVIPNSITKTFISLANGKLNWNGQLLSHLIYEIEQHPFISKTGAFEAFGDVLFYRINIAFLLTIFSLLQSINSDQKLIDNAKEAWIEIYKSSTSIMDKDDYLTMNRYLPKWVDLFLPKLNIETKKEFIKQLSVVDNNLADQLTLHPELKSHEILQKEFTNLISVLACSILHSKEKLENCTIEKAIWNLKQADLIDHSHSKVHSSDGIPPNKVKDLILQKQIDEINESCEIINAKSSKSIVNTISKPEFYNENKTLLSQQPYVPVPDDISRQVNLEMNYRLGKTIQKLREILNTKNLTKEKLTELCKSVNPYISLYNNKCYSIQYKDKKPIDAKVQTDIERFCATYSSYIRNACNELKTNDENTHLLGQLERVFKNDQYSQWQVNSSFGNSEKFMELNELREKLNQKNIQQKKEDEMLKESIANEYDALLDDINAMIIKEQQKYTRYHDNLVGNMKKSIQSHIISDEDIEKAIRIANREEQSNESKNNEENNEFPKLQINQNANNEVDLSNKDSSNENEFPKFQINQNNDNNEIDLSNKDSNNENEFHKLQVQQSNENNNNDKNEFPKIQVEQINDKKEFPMLQTDEQEGNSEDDFKFDHHVEFSPDSSRRFNRSEDDENGSEDDSLECRRSRPPSSTAGLLIAGEHSPVPPQSPRHSSARKRDEHSVPSPPSRDRPRVTTPLKRRTVRNAIYASYMNPKRVEKVEDEIDQLKKEILKIRVVHCMNLFAMEKTFNAKIATATQEYREINTIFWNSKRNFEEFVETMTRKIDEFYGELTNYEAEIEATKAKIEKRRHQTLQLLHWKQMNLQMCDSIQSQLKEFSTTNDSQDIDVLTLIKKVEESRAELDSLVMETEAFEEEFDKEIREPMAAIDYYKRKIAQTKRETAEMQYRAKMMQQNEDSESETEAENAAKEEEEESDDGVFECTEKFKLRPNINSNSNSNENQSLNEAENYKYNDDADFDDDDQNYNEGLGADGAALRKISGIQRLRIENQKIADANEQIRLKIRELEVMKAKLKPELQVSIEQLTSEPQATPRPLINQAGEKKIFRPAVPRRSGRLAVKGSLK